MKYVCNANCSWCLSKQNIKSLVKEKMVLDDSFMSNFINSLNYLKTLPITKLEFTGGGEPFLNEYLGEIISLLNNHFPSAYKKLYTNGFILKPVSHIDEINISRSHWDSSINQKIYKSPLQNDLRRTTQWFKQYVTKVRTCTVLQKGAIDSPEKIREMIAKLPEVDEFIFRPMNIEARIPDQYIDFDFTHAKAKKDIIDCTCHKSLVLAPDGKLYFDFNLKEEITLPLK